MPDELLIEVNAQLHVIVGRGWEPSWNALANQRDDVPRPAGLQWSRDALEIQEQHQ